MGIGRSRSRTGVHAASAAVALAASLCATGVASAAQEHELHAPVTATWEPSKTLTIQTGDSVRWTFDPGGFHNVQSTGTNWSPPIPDDDPKSGHEDVTHTFSTEGVYTFVCDAHPIAMDGTITVQDEPVDPPPPPTSAATAATGPPARHRQPGATPLRPRLPPARTRSGRRCAVCA